jgi:hypothetical protein
LFAGMIDEIKLLASVFDSQYNSDTKGSKSNIMKRAANILGSYVKVFKVTPHARLLNDISKMVEDNMKTELAENAARSSTLRNRIKDPIVQKQANENIWKIYKSLNNQKVVDLVNSLATHSHANVTKPKVSNFTVDFAVDSCTQMITTFNKLIGLKNQGKDKEMISLLRREMLKDMQRIVSEYDDAHSNALNHFRWERVGWRAHSINNGKPDITWYDTRLGQKTYAQDVRDILRLHNKNNVHFVFPFVTFETTNVNVKPVPSQLALISTNTPLNPPTEDVNVFVIGRATMRREVMQPKDVCVPVFSTVYPFVEQERHATIVFRKNPVGEGYHAVLTELSQVDKNGTTNGTYLKLNKKEIGIKLTHGVEYTLTHGAVICIGSNFDIDCKYQFMGPPGTPVKVLGVRDPVTYEEYTTVKNLLVSSAKN